jgi:hypothetical protein
MKKLFMQLSDIKINRLAFPEKKFLQSLYDRVSLKKNRLNKIFFWLTVLIACACTNKQASIENEAKDLRLRLSSFLKAVGEINVDSIQTYTYPKLFTIFPREQSRKSMERSYAFLQKNAELDSVKIDTIHPVFHMDKGSYSTAIYSMVIRMPLDSTENSTTKPSIATTGKKHLTGEKYPAPQSTLMATLMRNEYGVEVIGYEELDGMRTMRIRVAIIAAKDEFAKKWSFFTVTGDQELINKLFSRKVLEKLGSHN